MCKPGAEARNLIELVRDEQGVRFHNVKPKEQDESKIKKV
jgi:hypothetical protein